MSAIKSANWSYVKKRVAQVLFAGIFIAVSVLVTAEKVPSKMRMPAMPDFSLEQRVALQDDINIRSEAQKGDNIVGELNRGDEVSIWGETDDGWCQIGIAKYVKCELLGEKGK